MARFVPKKCDNILAIVNQTVKLLCVKLIGIKYKALDYIA